MTQPAPKPSSYVDQISGANLRAQVKELGNSAYATMVTPEHTQVWDADQLALQRRINDLAADNTVSVVPESISSPDDFEHLSLEQIRDLTFEMKPDVVLAAAQIWAKAGSEWADSARSLGDGVRTALVDQWEGQAAGKATAALGRFIDSSVRAGQAATMVGLKIGFAQRASDEAQRMMEPLLHEVAPEGAVVPQFPGTPTLGPAPTPGAAPPIMPPLGAAKDEQYKREEARAACLLVLRNVYAPGLHGGDQGVPALPVVTAIAGGAAPTAPQLSGGPLVGLEESTPDGGSTGMADSNSPGQPGSSHTAGGPSAFGGQPASTSPTGLHQPGAPGATDTPTTAAGMGSRADGGSPLGGGGYVGGRAGGVGGGGRNSRRGPGGGAPGGSASPRVPAGDRAGAPGSAGMSPGMMPPGGKPAEEKEHRSPGYLRGPHLQEWIDEGRSSDFLDGVIGVDPKPVPPEDPLQSARPSRECLPGEYR